MQVKIGTLLRQITILIVGEPGKRFDRTALCLNESGL